MKTVSALADRVCSEVNIPTSAGYKTAKVIPWLNQRYEDIYHRAIWPKTVFQFTLDAGVIYGDNTALEGSIDGDVLTLPKYVGSVLRITNQRTGAPVYLIDPASYHDRSAAYAAAVRALLGTDVFVPIGSRYGASQVLRQPAEPGTVSFVSTVNTDKGTGQSVWGFVRGRNSDGETISESIAFNGTTPVSTTAVFESVECLSKGKSDGTWFAGMVTVTADDGSILATISRYETSPQYEQLRLAENISENDVFLITAQRRFVPFLNAADCAVFDCDDALVAGAVASSWREQEKLDLSELWEARYEEEIKRLFYRELVKGGNAILSTPLARA